MEQLPLCVLCGYDAWGDVCGYGNVKNIKKFTATLAYNAHREMMIHISLTGDRTATPLIGQEGLF